MTSTGQIHTYLATPTHGIARSETTSKGVISPKILSEDARNAIEQQLRLGRFVVGLMGPQ
jgi:hypothetical protein